MTQRDKDVEGFKDAVSAFEEELVDLSNAQKTDEQRAMLFEAFQKWLKEKYPKH